MHRGHSFVEEVVPELVRFGETLPQRVIARRDDRVPVAVQVAEVAAGNPLDVSKDVDQTLARGDVVDIDRRPFLALPRQNVERDPCDRFGLHSTIRSERLPHSDEERIHVCLTDLPPEPSLVMHDRLDALDRLLLDPLIDLGVRQLECFHPLAQRRQSRIALAGLPLGNRLLGHADPVSDLLRGEVEPLAFGAQPLKQPVWLDLVRHRRILCQVGYLTRQVGRLTLDRMTERPNRIRHFRLLVDISQEELGRRVGVTKQSISDWERGKCWPSFRRATALADALSCSLDGLFVPSGSGGPPDNSRAAAGPVAPPVTRVAGPAEPLAEPPRPARTPRSRPI